MNPADIAQLTPEEATARLHAFWSRTTDSAT